MPSNILPFIVFLFFWNISPGPMITLVSRNSVKFSFKGGIAIMCGILLCDAIYLSLAFAGVSQFIAKHETIFYYAKIVGAFYILYIGVSILLNSKNTQDYTSQDGVSKNFFFKKEVVKGFLTNLSNPFTIVGMTSFILPFFSPDLNFSQKSLLAFFIPFSTLYCFLGVTFIFGNPFIRKLILPKMKWFEILAGIIISYMAISIVLF